MILMNIIEITKIYFKSFSDKNIIKLTDLYDDDVILKDWDINIKGKKNVIKANENLFNSVKSINIFIKNIYNDKLVVISEINIIINDNTKLNVVDIIKFNNNFKIIEIIAYKS
tara:strand:- start:42 stop:380 length:339 start_codon:yes stop_codon:yes gene_type:complete